MKQIFKNTLTYSLVSLLPYIMGFITLPMTLKYVSAAEYGTLGILENFNSIFVIFLTLQMSDSLIRLRVDYEENDSFLLSSIFNLSAIIIILFLICVLLFHNRMLGLFVKNNDIPPTLLYLSSAILAIRTLCSILTSYWISKGNSYHVFAYSIITSLINAALLFIFLHFFKLGIKAPLLATLLATLVGFFYLLKNTLPYLKLIIDLKIIKETLAFSLPVIPQSIGSYLFLSSDVLILEKHTSLEVVGVYVFANKLSSFTKFILNSLNSAIQPPLLSSIKNKVQNENAAVNDGLMINLSFTIFLNLGMLTITPIFLLYFNSGKYASSTYLCTVLVLGYSIRSFYNSYSTLISYYKETKIFALITISAGFANIGLNIKLIPLFGANAAAWTTAFSYFLTSILAFFYVKIFLKFQHTSISKLSFLFCIYSLSGIFNLFMLPLALKITVNILFLFTTISYIITMNMFEIKTLYIPKFRTIILKYIEAIRWQT